MLMRAATILWAFVAGSTTALAQEASLEHPICGGILRFPVYNEMRKLPKGQQHDFAKYDFYRTSVETEQQAREEGFDLDLVYESLGIGASSGSKWQKAVENRRIEKARFLRNFKSVRFDSFYRRVINGDSAKAVIKTADACINSTEDGLFCEVIRESPTALTYYVRYKSKQADETLPRVSSSSVIIGQATTSLFTPQTIISPRGLYKTVRRAGPNEEVNFSLSTTKNETCNKTVAASPRYAVAVTMVVTEERAVNSTTSISYSQRHSQCTGKPVDLIAFSADGCLPASETIDKGRLSVTTDRPPLNPQQPTCYTAINPTYTEVKGNCYKLSAQITECSQGNPLNSQDPQWKACQAAVKNGTPFHFHIGSVRTETKEIGRVRRIEADITGNTLVVANDQLPKTPGKYNVSYEVDIIDMISGAVVKLKPGSNKHKGFVANYDEASRNLTIVVP